jgi:glycosyltransferase involved in cell wall biosynthesis
MKLALAHEYFAARGGAEHVVDVLHAMWPEAPVYTFFHDRRRYGDLAGWDLRTSFLQQFPIGGGVHRILLPLYPRAARRLRVAEDTDLVLVSTSAFIKGLALPERTVEVAYCHSPTRYLWDWSDEYVREEVPAPLRGPVGELLAGLRETDRGFATRVDRWIANSAVVADRIRRYYGRESEVVHPPIDVNAFTPQRERGDFWVYVGRLSAYKRADIAVRAFATLGMRLVVVGEGRERGSLEEIARDNVAFAGHLDDATLRQLLGAARGLIFPAEDDFGIVCVEALASGAPVVALAAGGAQEIVRDGLDGALVATPDVDAFTEAVLRVEKRAWDPEALRESARRFDLPRFKARVRQIVEEAHRAGRTPVTPGPR